MKTERKEKRLLVVGQRLKKLRIKMGYTSYEHFAWDFGIPRVGYWKHENGGNITLKNLFRLLDIHKISPEDFFSEDFDKKY
ncbi:MAG: helix-turn-helix domain-containing protein [Bacteroidota bacterium]